MDVDVEAVPLREPGMAPFEVMTSESQERMLAIVTPDALSSVLEVCGRWEVRATVVGRVTPETGCGSWKVGTTRCWPTSRRRPCTRTPPSTIGPCGAPPRSTAQEPERRRDRDERR